MQAMSATKRQVRALFREAVFSRDKHLCRKCHQPSELMDAHHICDRTLMPFGGYVLENGITLCPTCHEKAEVFHQTGTSLPGYSPEDLFQLIGSTEIKARSACRRLAPRNPER